MHVFVAARWRIRGGLCPSNRVKPTEFRAQLAFAVCLASTPIESHGRPLQPVRVDQTRGGSMVPGGRSMYRQTIVGMALCMLATVPLSHAGDDAHERPAATSAPLEIPHT